MYEEGLTSSQAYRSKWAKDKYATNTRWSHIKHNYGMSREQYEAMFEAQHGLCASCGRPETELSRGGWVSPLSVDHSHLDGHIRGLVCKSCNKAIAFVKDDPAVADAVAAYLRRDQAR